MTKYIFLIYIVVSPYPYGIHSKTTGGCLKHTLCVFLYVYTSDEV